MWRAVFPSRHPQPHSLFPAPSLFIADAGEQFPSLGRRREAEGGGGRRRGDLFISHQLPVLRHFQDVNALTSHFLHPAAPLANDDAGPTSDPRIKKEKTSTASMKLWGGGEGVFRWGSIRPSTVRRDGTEPFVRFVQQCEPQSSSPQPSDCSSFTGSVQQSYSPVRKGLNKS